MHEKEIIQLELTNTIIEFQEKLKIKALLERELYGMNCGANLLWQ